MKRYHIVRKTDILTGFPTGKFMVVRHGSVLYLLPREKREIRILFKD